MVELLRKTAPKGAKRFAPRCLGFGEGRHVNGHHKGARQPRPSCPPQQASDPLKGSTVCSTGGTPATQLFHRVAVRRKRPTRGHP